MPNESPPTDRETEDKLIEACKQGDQRAFEKLIEPHGFRLLSIAENYLKNNAEASEVVGNAFMKAWRALAKGGFDAGRGKGNGIFPWLRKIVVNECLTIIRVKKRRGKLIELVPDHRESEEGGEEEIHRYSREEGGPPQDERAGPESLLAEEERRKAVKKEIRAKGLKATRWAHRRISPPDWRDEVKNILLLLLREDAQDPGCPSEALRDPRCCFDALRILSHPETERGLKEWLTAAEKVDPWRLSAVIALCAEAVFRCRLPRKGTAPRAPEKARVKGQVRNQLVFDLSRALRLAVGPRRPVHESTAAFMNAAFPSRKKWTAKRARQVLSRLGGGVSENIFFSRRTPDTVPD